jgi:cytochrome c551/c552
VALTGYVKGWNKMRVAGLAVVVALVALVAVAGVAAALTMQEAEKEFKAKGCTGCHNGAMAPDFQGTVKKIEEWAKKYGSLDEAVAAEAKNFKMYSNAKTWDQLISAMPGITPELRQFFEQIFEQAKSGGAGAGGGEAQQAPAQPKTVTVTVTQVRTVTQTVTEKVYVTETVTPPDKALGTANLIAKASYVVAILVAIAVVALAYMFMGRK